MVEIDNNTLLSYGDEFEVFEYIIGEDDSKKRLDVFVSEQYDNVSRSYAQSIIKDGNVTVNSKIQKSSYKLCVGDRVVVNLPTPKELEVEPQNIPIDIVYEDDDLIVVNKPQGMVVHPAVGNFDNTLVNAVLYHTKGRLSSINGVIRPGIVHRIDKNTSGLLVIAKNNNAHNRLSEQFKVHSITREYEMIAVGGVDWDKMTVDRPIGRNPKDRLKMGIVEGGKRAVTHFEVVERYDGFTHLKARLETGRTHQIRVHLNYLRHPILGDDLYGYNVKKFSYLNGQLLHARVLGFNHPTTGEYMEFSSELPDYFIDVIKKIRGNLSYN